MLNFNMFVRSLIVLPSVWITIKTATESNIEDTVEAESQSKRILCEWVGGMNFYRHDLQQTRFPCYLCYTSPRNC